MIPRAVPLAVLLLAAGCADGEGERPCSADEDAELLAIGDSFLAWSSGDCASIPDVLAEELGRPVHNAAVSGARVSHPDGEDIASQYVTSSRSWVLIEGGVNDLNAECGCDGCGAVLDALVSEDGAAGELVELVERATADGASVALLGYPDLPSTALYGFAACDDEIPELRARQRALAQARGDVLFVDGAAAITPDDLASYYADHVHPSEAGSRALGELVAAAIAAYEAR